MSCHEVFCGIIASDEQDGISASRVVCEVLGAVIDFTVHNKLYCRQN